MRSRKSASYSFLPEELKDLKQKMLNWLRPFSIFSYFDNNLYAHKPNRFELIAACDIIEEYTDIPPAYAGDWTFGHVTYDYKNKIFPNLKTDHKSRFGFEDSFFYHPQYVVFIPFGKYELIVETIDGNPEDILDEILGQEALVPALPHAGPLIWQYVKSKEQYLEEVRAIQRHIVEGDCYELNLCVKATAHPHNFDPVAVFNDLNKRSPSPFAALYRNENNYLICASPERFLYKKGDTILSQPIKGTIARLKDPMLDKIQKENIFSDEKERAENVMIVDLVRNDLSQCCEVGSIHVPELFGVYTFPQLHHLISTIAGKLLSDRSLADIFKVTFPMGSMTGAPKMMVMELIEKFEAANRGIYSGTIGYITPQNDFDFNVVIRSLVYNQDENHLSCQAGGAITIDSTPEKEWEELLLKASAMNSLFQER